MKDIAKILEEKNMTVQEFAEAIGVKELAVYSWVSGLQGMCRTSEIAIDVFLAGGVLDKEYTREDWLKYKKTRTAAQAAKETGLGLGSVNRLSHVREYNKRMQIILSNRAII